MAAKKKASAHAIPKVGSTVRFRFGVRDVTAKVIEDRGNLGQGGARILRVRFQFRDTSDPIETEIEAKRLRVVTPAR